MPATRVERKRNDNGLFDAFAGFRRTYSVEHWRPCKQRLTFSFSFNVQALKVSTKTNRAGVLRVFLQILVSKYSPFLDKRAYVGSLFCACSSIFFVGLLALQNPHKFYIYLGPMLLWLNIVCISELNFLQSIIWSCLIKVITNAWVSSEYFSGPFTRHRSPLKYFVRD